MNSIPTTPGATVEIDGLQITVRAGAIALAAILSRGDALILADRLRQIAGNPATKPIRLIADIVKELR